MVAAPFRFADSFSCELLAASSLPDGLFSRSQCPARTATADPDREHDREVVGRERAHQARGERLAQHAHVVLDVVVARIVALLAGFAGVGDDPSRAAARAVDAHALADATTPARPLASIASYGSSRRRLARLEVLRRRLREPHARRHVAASQIARAPERVDRRRGTRRARRRRRRASSAPIARRRNASPNGSARLERNATPRSDERAVVARAARSSSARATASRRSGRRTRAARAAASSAATSRHDAALVGLGPRRRARRSRRRRCRPRAASRRARRARGTSGRASRARAASPRWRRGRRRSA